MNVTGRSTPANLSASAATLAASRAPVLELDHVTLELGDRTILRDAGFVVNQGEFIGVLGPNGAGKTTLMRAVLGLVPAASGSIRVLGSRWSAATRRSVICRKRAARSLDGECVAAISWRWRPTATVGAYLTQTPERARTSSAC